MSRILLALVIVAAPAGTDAAPLPIMSAAVADCVNLLDYPTVTHAVPNDGVEDQGPILAAIQYALSTPSHTVCVPKGVYDIGLHPGGVSFDLGQPFGTSTPATDLTIIGEGPGSVLRMNGNGAGGTWYLFEIWNGAARIHFRDLTLDGSKVASPGTSTKLIQVGVGDTGGAHEISFENVTFLHSPKDAIEILGAATAVTIDKVAFRACRVSGNAGKGINILTGSADISVLDSEFELNGGIDIGTGQTSGSSSLTTPIGGLVIANNTVIKPTTATSPIAVALFGYASSAKDAVISHNSILGRVQVKAFDRIAITGNFIAGGAQATTDPELDVRGQADYVLIEGNQLVRSSSSAAAVLQIIDVGGLAPRRTVIRDNIFVQSSAANIVTLQSITGVVASNNYLDFESSSTGASNGITFRATNKAMDDLVVSGNHVAGNRGGGSLAAAFSFAPGASFAINRVVVTGNVTQGTTNGAVFATGAAYSTKPIVAANMFEATTDVVGFPLGAVAIGGNLVGPVQLSGNGSPLGVVTAPVGSTFVQRDAGGKLYVKESGTGSTGWVAK